MSVLSSHTQLPGHTSSSSIKSRRRLALAAASLPLLVLPLSVPYEGDDERPSLEGGYSGEAVSLQEPMRTTRRERRE